MRSLRIVPVVFIAGISCAVGYRGDGAFVDAGSLSAHERYTIDLGKVDLGKLSRQEFHLGQLPATEFTFGLKLTSKSRPQVPIWESRSLNPTIRLSLVDEANRSILSISGPLETWTRSGAVTEPARAFVDRRGSDFKPDPKSTYLLVLETLASDHAAEVFEAHLVAIGGGWK